MSPFRRLRHTSGAVYDAFLCWREEQLYTYPKPDYYILLLQLVLFLCVLGIATLLLLFFVLMMELTP